MAAAPTLKKVQCHGCWVERGRGAGGQGGRGAGGASGLGGILIRCRITALGMVSGADPRPGPRVPKAHLRPGWRVPT